MPICTGAGFGALGNFVIIANVGARPTGAARYPGVLVFQADTKLFYFWDGAAWQLAPYTGPSADVQNFTTVGAYTYTKQSWATLYAIILIAGGAGGSSGAAQSAGANRLGGAGGGAGGRVVTLIPAAYFGATFTIHVGAGGAGAASPGNSSFGISGSFGAATYLDIGGGTLHPFAPGGSPGFMLASSFGTPGAPYSSVGGQSGDGNWGSDTEGQASYAGAGGGGGSNVSAYDVIHQYPQNGGNSAAGPGGGGAGGGTDALGNPMAWGPGGTGSGLVLGGMTAGAAGADAPIDSGCGGGGGAGGSYPNVSGGHGGWPGGGGGGGCGMADGFTGVVGGNGASGYAQIVAIR